MKKILKLLLFIFILYIMYGLIMISLFAYRIYFLKDFNYKNISFNIGKVRNDYFLSYCFDVKICYIAFGSDVEIYKLIWSNKKIKNIHINNSILYITLPKNSKYNIVKKNIVKISDDNYKIINSKDFGDIEYLKIQYAK